MEDRDSGSGGRTVCNISDGSTDLVLSPLTASSSASIYRLTTARSLDRERAARLSVTVSCHDGGRPPLSTEEKFSVIVLDQNDHAPRFLQSGGYSVNVRENGSVPQMPILKVKAVDADEGPNADVWYSLSDTPAARYTANYIIISG